jgi:hypothetical protein
MDGSVGEIRVLAAQFLKKAIVISALYERLI